jgi:Tol biopolymer transport system component
MNDDGAGLIRMTVGPPPDHEPAWSPGGGRIALRVHVAASSAVSVNGDVHIMNLDGSGLINVTNDPDAFDIQPAWAPDEARVVYTRLALVDRSSAIFIVGIDGAGKRQLTAGSQPHWSPDGTKIVFVDANVSGVSDLFIVKPDGSGRSALTNTPSVIEDEPEWSPDGSRIAYIANASGRFEIHAINADGSGSSQLTSGISGVPHKPTWSPDGRRIAFFLDDEDEPEIYVMNADGTNVTRLTYGGAQHPSWRP